MTHTGVASISTPPRFTFAAALAILFLTLGLPVSAAAQQESGDFLSPSEVNEIRDAQDINQRVPLYLKFAATRLEKAQKLAGIPSPKAEKEEAKERRKPAVPIPPDMKPEKPESLEQEIDEYYQIYDEMLRHLDERLDAGDDARKALKAILKESPGHLTALKALQEKLGDDAPDVLDDAMTDTSDAIEGAQKTLPGLEEKFEKEKKQKNQDREKRSQDI